MRTNEDRVVAAVALCGTILQASPNVTDYSIRHQPEAELNSAFQESFPEDFFLPLHSIAARGGLISERPKLNSDGSANRPRASRMEQPIHELASGV
jgi:hypothetical protein